MKKLSSLLLMLFVGLAASAQTQLGLNLKEGETYKQITNYTSKIKQEVMGQSIDMEMLVSGNMNFKVVGIQGDAYQMQAEYDQLKLSMKMPQMSMEVSSESGADDHLSRMLAEMKNKPFDLVMQKNGQITEVKNVESLWESAFGQFDDISEAEREQIKAQVMQAYGPDAMKGNIEMVSAIFPDEPVKEGDSWQITTALKAGMAGDVNSTYTLERLDESEAVLLGDGKFKSDADNSIETNGMEMTYDMEGSMNSQIVIDLETGWIKSANIDQNFKGLTKVEPSAQLPQGMEIPIEVVGKMEIKN